MKQGDEPLDASRIRDRCAELERLLELEADRGLDRDSYNVAFLEGGLHELAKLLLHF